MGQVVVYGASDDLIEVEGDIRDEFYAGPGGQWLDALVFQDGSVVTAEYTREGTWSVGLHRVGSASAKREFCPRNDEDNYSDRLTLTTDEPIEWVVHCRVEVDA